MSYIQIELGGKMRGLKFNQLALEEFAKKLPAGNIPNTMLVYAEVWAGLLGNAYVKGEEPDYTFEEVCDWCDELYAAGQTDVINSIDATLSGTQVYKALLASSEKIRSKESETTDKKKAKKVTS